VDLDQARVLAREADGVRTVPVHHGHDLAVHFSDERHADDVDGLRVGDPPALDELRFLPEPPHEIGDLRSAAVDDDRVHAAEPHQHDMGRKQLGYFRFLHRVTAVLDDDGLARELADVRQRIGEDVRLLPRVLHTRRDVDRLAHDVRRFSSMYACDRSVVRTVASPCAWRRSQRISMSVSATARANAASSCAVAMPSRQTVIPLYEMSTASGSRYAPLPP